MGQCESCVNTSKTAKGAQNLSYQKGKKRHTKPSGSRRNSISTGSDYAGSGPASSEETTSQRSAVQKSDFRILRTIGRGTYGKVYLVQHHQTEQIFAMKSVQKEMLIRTDQVAGIRVEREILEKFDHPFIMGLEFAFQDADRLYLIMEFVNGGELFFHLKQVKGGFDEERARFYAAEMILALEYLHKSGVVYRDLKPENILIDNEGHIRLTDFGLSKSGLENTDGRTESFCGTPEYLAPEIIRDKEYGYSVDWYSFGLVLYEMLTGINPFKTGQDLSLVEKMNEILNKEIPIPKKLSVEARDLLKQILKKHPEERIGCKEAGVAELKAHPFFTTVDWDQMYMKEVQPPFVPNVERNSDVSNVDPEFLAEAPNETPIQTSQLAAMANQDGDFYNFTYVNENNLSELSHNASAVRPATELMNLKQSFVSSRPDDEENQSAYEAAQLELTQDSQQAGSAQTYSAQVSRENTFTEDWSAKQSASFQNQEEEVGSGSSH